MYQLKRSQVQLIAFVLVDNSGIPVTGLADTFSLSLSKAGGAFTPSTGAKAEIGNGWYTYELSAAEVSTVGPLAIICSGAGTIQQNLMYVVESYVVGAVEFNYTVTDSGTGVPIEGVTVYITTNLAGTVVIWTGISDGLGVARDAGGNLPLLYPGTYYVWRLRYGYVFTNPDTEVIA